MNQAALEMLREIFGGIPRQTPGNDLALDIPSKWCRGELTAARTHLAVMASCILHNTEDRETTHKDAQRICDFLSANVKIALDEAGVAEFDSMDWPHVKAELLATLKGVIEAIETGPAVITPQPRSAQAIELFSLNEPKPEADFLKPQMADARAFGRTPTSPGYREVPPPVHGEAEAKAEQTIAQAFAKPPHGGYPSMGQTVAEGFLTPELMAETKASLERQTKARVAEQQLADKVAAHPFYTAVCEKTFPGPLPYDLAHKPQQIPGHFDMKTGEFIPDAEGTTQEAPPTVAVETPDWDAAARKRWKDGIAQASAQG